MLDIFGNEEGSFFFFVNKIVHSTVSRRVARIELGTKIIQVEYVHLTRSYRVRERKRRGVVTGREFLGTGAWPNVQ